MAWMKARAFGGAAGGRDGGEEDCGAVPERDGAAGVDVMFT